MGGGASADAMWGPAGGPLWGAHTRRSTSTSSAASRSTWLPRARATWATSTGCRRLGPNITGGFIERIVAESTKVFADNAAAAGVPITYVVRPDGSHTWGLFESEMQESWNTTIGPALGR
jgi:S-formylglutathione hydrolase FrmB